MCIRDSYVPLWGFPLRLAVVNGHFKHLPSRLPKRHSSNSLYGRTAYSDSYTHLDVYKRQVVIPFLGKVHIIMVGTLVSQQQSPVDIVLDGVLLR